MGKKIKSREAQRRAAVEAVDRRLRAHSRAEIGPALVESYYELEPLYRGRIEAYRGHALNAPDLWRCRLRSRSTERRFLDLVKFTFAKYRVPKHLEQVWLDAQAHVGGGGSGDLRRWYILVGQGRSLYKEAARAFMSKVETHHFLSAPADLPWLRAFWYAFARAHGADESVAQRIARTRLAGQPVASPFWKEVARYFARNPIATPEMNDLIDFIQAAKEEDENFSLAGRSLEALRRRTIEWHRALRRRQTVCGGSWDGCPLPDVDYEAGREGKRAIWRFRQIRSGNDLYKEGARMHHCVVTYKPRCMSGDISIWSLTCEFPIGKVNRGVTLEVRNDGAIMQCRGFANRLPYANEVTMVRRWAGEHGLKWTAAER